MSLSSLHSSSRLILTTFGVFFIKSGVLTPLTKLEVLQTTTSGQIDGEIIGEIAGEVISPGCLQTVFRGLGG